MHFVHFEKNTIGKLKLCARQWGISDSYAIFTIKNYVGINRLVQQLGSVQMFHNMQKSSNSYKCHIESLQTS